MGPHFLSHAATPSRAQLGFDQPQTKLSLTNYIFNRLNKRGPDFRMGLALLIPKYTPIPSSALNGHSMRLRQYSS
jgi:hypothetical protein